MDIEEYYNKSKERSLEMDDYEYKSLVLKKDKNYVRVFRNGEKIERLTTLVVKFEDFVEILDTIDEQEPENRMEWLDYLDKNSIE